MNDHKGSTPPPSDFRADIRSLIDLMSWLSTDERTEMKANIGRKDEDGINGYEHQAFSNVSSNPNRPGSSNDQTNNQ